MGPLRCEAGVHGFHGAAGRAAASAGVLGMEGAHGGLDHSKWQGAGGLEKEMLETPMSDGRNIPEPISQHMLPYPWPHQVARVAVTAS